VGRVGNEALLRSRMARRSGAERRDEEDWVGCGQIDRKGRFAAAKIKPKMEWAARGLGQKRKGIGPK
jgi:hypothetical protein